MTVIRRPRAVVALLLLLLALPLAAAESAEDAAAEPETVQVTLDRWLVAGPVAGARPAFVEETGVARREALELAEQLPGWPWDAGTPWPQAGGAFLRADGGSATWSEVAGGDLGLDAAEGERPHVVWLAAFLESDRFVKGSVTLTTGHLARLFLDGEQVAEKTSADGDDAEETGEASGEIALTTGKHLLLVAALRDPHGPEGWSLEAVLEVPAERQGSLAVSTSPRRGITIPDLLDPPQVDGVDLSADGTLVAVSLEQPAVPAERRTAWVEIVRAADGAPVHTLRLAGSVSDFAWAPQGHRFAYRTREDGTSTLWVADLTSGRRQPVMADVERLEEFRWAPDGRSLFVQVSDEAEGEGDDGEDDRGAVRVRSLPDRWAGFRELGALHQVAATAAAPAAGRSRRLTAGPLSVYLEDVAPDGSRLLVSRTRYTLERPFAVGELWEIDLESLEPSKLTDVVWLGGAEYSPDGETLLITAGPSAFDGAGLDVPEGTIPSEYDGQAYLYDRASGEVTALTRDFDPAVRAARWSPADGAVYLLTTETSYGPLYRWHPEEGTFQRLAGGAHGTGPDVVSGVSLARSAPGVALTGSSLQTPQTAWVLDGPGAAPRPLLEPAADVFRQVDFGRVEDFDFTTADGTMIPGRLYYPLDYEEGRTYPLLVYYYGGVVPTTRSFGGRYPKNLWAARGYAVYVLQPSGAVGFGQQLSARHVNDWGQRILGEILGGVDAVVAAHPFLDGDRVGCFGGSYGGFTTMRLVTESDRFAAAISHAGISGIASYWGEGWWGYIYMAAAAAGSYPWNSPELYVERSPLFKADRVDTPLLLLHGTADPNVPPGESEQMFAALRVLGKEVEYVRIADEAHWILSYPKRVLWWDTILAWFDKHLKDQPEHWEELWGGELRRSGP